MAVVLMIEFDVPKEESRYKKFAEFISWRKGVAAKYQELIETLDKMSKEGSLKTSQWADDTGHIISWWEFDSTESFAKLWSVDEWHKYALEQNPLVDHKRSRLLRPVRMITEDVIPY